MGFLDKLKGAAESVQAQTSKVGVGADAGQMALANRGKRLMDAGVDTPGHIDSMTPTGKTDTPGAAEYQVSFNQYIYPSAPFSAGEDVTIRVDPDDPNSVMLWGKA